MAGRSSHEQYPVRVHLPDTPGFSNVPNRMSLDQGFFGWGALHRPACPLAESVPEAPNGCAFVQG